MHDETKQLDTAKIIDEIIKVGATTGTVASAFIAPNIVIALEKPLKKLYKHLDQRERKREAMRIIYSMKQRGYLAGDYEHGLKLTQKAKERYRKIQLDEITIHPTNVWDSVWRLVLYDIPEDHRVARIRLTSLLRNAGCFQLQKSAWITPFPCRNEVQQLTGYFDINQYVSYLEVVHLDNQQVLLRRFAEKYPSTNFDL